MTLLKFTYYFAHSRSQILNAGNVLIGVRKYAEIQSYIGIQEMPSKS